MATTIDSLQIQIQSSSGTAAAGIRDVAAAMAEMKRNGTITTAVKNLRELGTVLSSFSSSSAAANVLSSLASSLTSLKSAGSIGSAVNGLKALPAALSGLSAINVEAVAPQIRAVASALAPLSQIKGGGFSSMINSLSKLDKVTESLSDEKIEAFATKVKKLVKELEPLSSKMTTIQSGLKSFDSNAKKAGNSAQTMGTKVNAASVNLASMFYNLQTTIMYLRQAYEAFAKLISAAIEWDGVAARFGRGFGSSSQETYGWIQKLNEEMGINTQQFMQYSSIYATMLNGFGVASEDAGKMALGYMELTYDIWAGYNDQYKTLQDAADAIKSAIAGEVEPIRRAGLTITEATLRETAANHGLKVSLDKATEAQKSYLRYLTLVDRAYAQNLVGTYAAEMNTAEGVIRTFTQQLKSLAQAFGSLFLPVLVKVVPYVEAFVDLLAEGVRWIASLFGIEIQAVDFSGYESGATAVDGVTDSLDKATKSAKALKNATIGIDELNVISPNSGSGGGAGGAGGGFERIDVDSIWDESIFESIDSQVDEIKEKMGDWLVIIGGIAVALAGLRLTKLLSDVTLAGVGLGRLVTTAGISIVVGKIVWDLTGAYLESGDVKDWLNILGTTALGTAVAYYLAGPVGAGLMLAVSGVVSLTKLTIDISNGEVDWSSSQSWITLLTSGATLALSWKTLGPAITKALSSSWTSIAAGLAKIPVWGWVAAAVVALIAGCVTIATSDMDFKEAGRNVGRAIGNAIGRTGQAILEGLKSAFKWVKDNFDIQSIRDLADGEKWANVIVPNMIQTGKDMLAGLWKGISDGWTNFWNNIHNWLVGIVEGINEELGIHSPSTVFAEIGKNLIDGLLLGLQDTWKDVQSWWKESIAPKFTKEFWVDKFKGLKDGFIQTIKNMLNTAIEKVNGFIRTLNQKMKFSWPAVPALNIEAGSIQLFTIPEIPKVYANGGIIEDGLFTMNRGEMAGKFDNGRSVVANNEMIVDGIAAGVYQAVVSAMTETNGGGGQSVNVYLDGKQIYASVKRVESERGRTLMGNQLGYSY